MRNATSRTRQGRAAPGPMAALGAPLVLRIEEMISGTAPAQGASAPPRSTEPGFVVTGESFQRFIDDAALTDGPERSPVPPEVDEAIGAEYWRLCDECGALPAHVTVHTAPTSRHPGAMPVVAFGNVCGAEEVVARVRDCWLASIEAHRDGAPVPVAVIVQRVEPAGGQS